MSRNARLPEFLQFAHRFTLSTRGRLERSFVVALQDRWRSSPIPLRKAVRDATHELQAAGLGDQAVLDVLGTFVEEAGRAVGADRLSLISGEPRWVPVRAQVLALARGVLQPLPGGPAPRVVL